MRVFVHLGIAVLAFGIGIIFLTSSGKSKDSERYCKAKLLLGMISCEVICDEGYVAKCEKNKKEMKVMCYCQKKADK